MPRSSSQNADGSYNTTLGLGGPAGDAFASYLQKLGQEKVLDPAIDGEKAKQAFLDGQAPYIITGPWNTTAFTDAGMDITVLPVPTAGGEPAQPFVGVQGAFISSKSKNAVLANEFVVNFLTTEKVQTELYEPGGRLPALTASAEKVSTTRSSRASTRPARPVRRCPRSRRWAPCGASGATPRSRSSTARRLTPPAAWNTMTTNIQGAIDGS